MFVHSVITLANTQAARPKLQLNQHTPAGVCQD